MNLGDALHAAISARWPSPEPTSPATSTRGRIARMNALEKVVGGPKEAAQAAGVSPETWRRWKLTSGRFALKKPPAKLGGLLAAVRPLYENARRRRIDRGLARVTNIRATAVIYWNGYLNQLNEGYRGVNFGPMRLGDLAALWAAGDKAGLAARFQELVEQQEGVPVQFKGDNVHVEIT